MKQIFLQKKGNGGKRQSSRSDGIKGGPIFAFLGYAKTPKVADQRSSDESHRNKNGKTETLGLLE